jgi:cytochrome c553
MTVMKRITLVLAIAAFSVSTTAVAYADGAALWKKCAKCHGADGKGDTKMGKKLKVRDLTKADVQASFTNDDIKKAIKEGVKNDAGKKVMKGDKGKLGDADIASLIKFTRSFKGK